MKVEEMVAVAKTLTAKDLRRLVDALVVELAERSLDPSDRHLVAVHGILARRLDGVLPYPLLMRSGLGTEFRAFVRAMDAFADKQQETLPLPIRLALYDMLVVLVLEWLKEVGVPPALTTVCRQGGRLEGLVDRAFPGYMRAGLLSPFVLRRWAQTGKKI